MNKVPFVSTLGLRRSLVQGEVRLSVLLSSLVLILVTGIFAQMASAATGAGKAVYGPETFGRGLYFRFFQVAAPTGEYILSVQNGDQAGQHRVNSALITLNGKVVVGLRDLTVNTASVSKTVTLKKLNVLTFLITGKQGSYITFSINGQTANTPPIANAGPDQSGQLGSTITLDGSASSDFDGDLLTYNWNLTSKPTGSAALLTNPNTTNPTLFLDKSGTYVGSLVVNDGKVNSAPDTITISTLNVPPVADAGGNQRAQVNTTVTLDGSGSTDADGDSLTYAWSFSAKPTGSGALLSSSTAVKPTFSVDKPGTYVLQLVVNDGKVNSQAAQVTVTTENTPPVAHAGADQSTAVNTQVTLDGSASSDVDGDLLTYAWSFTSLPDGSQAALSDPTAVNPHFTVDKPGSYTLQLLVKDGVVESLADTVTITTLNSKPVALAGADQTVALNQLVNLDGQNSTDADGDTLTYAWTLTTKPTGSIATLLNPTSPQPSFTADKAGTYVAQLIVNDGTVDSDPATVTISTLNSKPVANAGPDQTVPFNSLVKLDGSASADADNDTLTYAWSFTAKPVGSNAILTGNTTAEPSFTGDVAGTYVVELIVNDGKESGAPDTVSITVEPAVPVNTPPIFTSIPVAQATEGQGYSYQVTVIDGNSDALTYALINNPPQNMTITSTGLITWIPSSTQVGDFPVTVTVTDNKSAPVEQSFIITVKAAIVTVPDVVGLNQAAAQTAITGANLTVGTITQVSSATVAAGNVISQNPAANTSVAKNTAVALEISTGPASGGGNLPSDPATVAPTIDPTVATTLHDSTAFLYTGDNPVQTGVAPGTIEAKRAAVIRGKVLDRTNQPLPGVTITILNHPEWGQTISRADGQFDLAVNGGGYLTVNYQKTGYLPVQRQINTPWQDFALVDDVVMILVDSQVTAVDLANTAAIQVAQGSPVTDEDGTRQATLLFTPGTTAALVLPDGSSQSIASLHVRATEYTVGAHGPETMPGELPPASGYTYAVELSADEALAAGATSVTFSQPVIQYVNNFMGFPVGMKVPAGYYDRKKGIWVASTDGRVIKVLSVTGSLADVDVNGDGNADAGTSLSNLGINDAERERLAGLYAPGTSLWRVPITHFTPWDYNWPFGPPAGAEPPQSPKQDDPAKNKKMPDKRTECPGCIVEVESQVLGERVGLTGTALTLNYRSDRVPGRTGDRTLKIPVTGATVPSSLSGITLEIEIAGRRFSQIFPKAANQTYTFTWDGKDVYGRTVQGLQAAQIRIQYTYPAVAKTPSTFQQSFGQVGGATITAVRARQEINVSQVWQEVLGNWDTRGQGLAGWTLSVHHAYDPLGKTLYLGDGSRRSAQGIGLSTISTVAGTGASGYSGDGGPATNAMLFGPGGVALSPDGSLYIADSINSRIRRVGPDGIITTVAGTGTVGYSGDGGPATGAQLGTPNGIAVSPDGGLYIADYFNNSIRRVGPDGIITTVAGTGASGYSGDGGPATNAMLFGPGGVALSPDGSLYIADSGRIRRVGSDGIITTVAGTGASGYSGDGGPATGAMLGPTGVALSPDGSLYIADSGNSRIRRVGPDGIITTVAGTGASGYSGDGGPATGAMLFGPGGVALSPDGSLYIADSVNNRIRRVGPDGIITTVAGTGTKGYSGDGGPATGAQLAGYSFGIAVSPDGSLYITDTDYVNSRIRRIEQPLPGSSVGDIMIPSENGAEVFIFSSAGRHLRTLHALTGAVLYQFNYDSAGRLLNITDGSGNVTALERDVAGNPTAIIAPFGQRTTLALDGNGYLTSVTNPAGERHAMIYSADGLLTQYTDPKSLRSTFTYDDSGRLLKDENPAAGFQSLARTEDATGANVTRTTALGRTEKFRMEYPAIGGSLRDVQSSDGTHTQTVTGTDGSEKTTLADGTVSTMMQGADPRFSMLAPIPTSMNTSTGGLTSTTTTARNVVLSDPNNPLSLTSVTDTRTVNGRTYTSVFDAVNRLFTATSPAGRQETSDIDTLGRPVQVATAGLLAVNNSYDTLGRLVSLTQGSDAEARIVNFAYNSAGYLDKITDPLGRLVSYEYDLAGRMTRQNLPDGRSISYSYDANGNLTALMPPGRPAHVFKYTSADLTGEYVPPDVGAGANSTVYTYDLDKALTRISRPDGQTVDFSYDSAGRLAKLSIPGNDFTYAYNAATGKLDGISVLDGSGLNYTYQGALLAETAWTGTIAGKVGYAYDNDFRVTSLSVNDSNPVAFQYDADSLLTQAGDLTLSRNSQNSLLTGSTLGSVTDSFTYDGFGEMTRYEAKVSGASAFATDASYDKLGRITQKVEHFGVVANTFDYTYDISGRLIEVKRNGATTSAYAYDDNGNRLSRTQGGTQITGIYDDQDRLLSYGNATYAYTANGELQSRTVGGQATQYQYDVLGNLKQVILPNGTVIDYLADAGNRRIGKKVNGTLVQGFLWQDQLKPIAELDGQGNVVSRFVYATRVNVPDYMIKGGVIYRIVTDHLGSPRLVIKADDGTVVQSMDYDEFGNVIGDSNPGFQPFGFAGGLYDRDTGLVRFGVRDYDAYTGRWTAKDPIGFIGSDTNLYGYSLNDPLNINDAHGTEGTAIQQLESIIRRLKQAKTSQDLVNILKEWQTLKAKLLSDREESKLKKMAVQLATEKICTVILGEIAGGVAADIITPEQITPDIDIMVREVDKAFVDASVRLTPKLTILP
jgi:RHS repeat-associated protein